MSSYQLLKELDTHFPRVYISEKTENESASAITSLFELVVAEEAWSPFIFGVDCSFTKKGASREKPSGSLDPSGFHLLIKDLYKMDNEESAEESQTKMFVNEVLGLVELDTLKEALVGLPGVSGLSTEQSKRLTIAVELVSNPSIIFMDEPTSGLDARAAAIVMRKVRNTVDTGRTFVCTIHQPSIDIFEAFDELFLMKRGGQEIYMGPVGRQSCKLIKYFELKTSKSRDKSIDPAITENIEFNEEVNSTIPECSIENGKESTSHEDRDDELKYSMRTRIWNMANQRVKRRYIKRSGLS